MQDDQPTIRKSGSLAERVVGKLTRQDGGAGHQDKLAARQAAATEESRPKAPEAPPAKAAVPAKPEAAPAKPPVAEPVTAEPSQPPLEINFNRLASFGFITPSTERSNLTEEFRVIKRQVLKTAFEEGHNRRTENSNIIMVTSTSPAEGKTFVSLNLAVSLSMERDYYVLLIDGDNHRHSLTDIFGIEPGQDGLVDLMVDRKLNLRDIIRRTNIPNLSFIPAGRPYAHGAELLSSKEMASIMQDIAQRYPDRIVIIDTPPLTASTEGAVLSSNVGHALVVVEKDRTTKRQLQQTLQMLEGCPEVSCVLNMDTAAQRFSPYAYGY